MFVDQAFFRIAVLMNTNLKVVTTLRIVSVVTASSVIPEEELR